LKPSPDLSIVIVNLDQQELLADCLTSVYDTLDPAAVQVIVVDNGSEDGSLHMLRGGFPQVEVLANEANLGFAAANNQGLAKCRGRYIVLLNNDTIVKDNALGSLAEFMDLHQEVGCAGPQLHNADGSIQASCLRFPSLLRGLRSFVGARVGKSTKYVPELEAGWAYVDAVSGACMILRRETLADVGLLDDGYFMYAEEVDWCYRARQAGWPTAYCAASQVIHLGGQTARLEPTRFYIERRYSRVRFMLKHHGQVAARATDYMIRLSALMRWGLATGSKRSHYRQILKSYTERVRPLFQAAD
jgi:N-acetylglucosaminyl-diphospho-decaprenol L-rhamnosyltransferase